jgi:hypothetical protein
MGAGSAVNVRLTNDAYMTPPWCVEWLVGAEGRFLPKLVWEPCSGNGDITRVLRGHGCEVVESDLDQGVDFLQMTGRLAPGAAIITNPPYSLASEFIRHAHRLGVHYHAWLLKADFLNALRAIKLIDEVGYPARIWVLTKRPDFLGQGAPTMNCAWFIWSGRSTSASLALLTAPGSRLGRAAS